MVSENQMRKFVDSNLPNIKVNHFSTEKNQWICVFQEDFKYPYISLTTKQIEESTELIKSK